MLRPLLPQTDLLRGLEAVHLGHLAVHEDEVVATARERGERVAPARNHLCDVAVRLELANRDVEVHGVVVHHQDEVPSRSLLPHADRRRARRLGTGRGRALVRRPGRHRQPLEALDEPCRQHGLREARREACIAQDLLAGSNRRHQDDRGCFAICELPDGAPERQAVEVGQIEIDEREVDPRRGGGAAQALERAPTVLGLDNFETPGFEHVPQHAAADRVLLDQQDAAAGQPRDVGRLAEGNVGRHFERNREPERRALARHALHADRAPHELDELLADREPEPGPAVTARR